MFSFNHSNTFSGGVYPDEQKELSEHLAFEIFPLPKQIIIPLSQHAGKPAKPLVKKGSEVKAGEIIAEPDGFISSPIHSPVCGKVTKIFSSITPGGYLRDSILIESGEQNEIIKMPAINFETAAPEEIIDRVKLAGVVGQGGAAFPTFVKLSPPKDKKIDYIILNGCECEPYLTRDYRFMIERTDDVVAGLRIIMKAIGVDKGAIGVEDNKPDAIKKLNDAVKNQSDISVVKLKTKYPQGAEKMLIEAVAGREVPPGKLPFVVGCVIQNIGTAIAIYDAVVNGEPQLTAALTVSGKGINQPKNLIVPVGTSIGDVLDYCGGVTNDAVKVIVGGPMMGVAQFDLSAPVMKATSGILVLTEKEVNHHAETNCLRCGKCVDVCPLNLLPTKLSRLSQLEKYEDAEQLNITTCMECGTCTFTCPANIPLVQWIRLGKQKVLEMQRERQAV
jgi:electron transport complex protein RnfC